MKEAELRDSMRRLTIVEEVVNEQEEEKMCLHLVDESVEKMSLDESVSRRSMSLDDQYISVHQG